MMSDVNVNTTTPPPPGVNSLALLATKANNKHIRQFVDVDAVAGAFAGCISRLVVQPLDVIKIRLQVQVESSMMSQKYSSARQAFSSIIREEGLKGLWRGTVPAQMLSIPYCAVQFATLRVVRDVCANLKVDETKNKQLISFGSGAAAGVVATFASYPFDYLRTVLAAQGEPAVFRTTWDAALHTLETRGIRGLYAGVAPTFLEIVPYAALQFGVYDLLRERWDSLQISGNQATKSFVCGLAAGILAKAATHPLDVLKKRYQVAGLPRSLRYGRRVSQNVSRLSLVQYAATMYRHEGIRGFYRGLNPSLLKAAPSAAVTLTAFELARAALVSAGFGDQSGPTSHRL